MPAWDTPCPARNIAGRLLAAQPRFPLSWRSGIFRKAACFGCLRGPRGATRARGRGHGRLGRQQEGPELDRDDAGAMPGRGVAAVFPCPARLLRV
ncbi:Hypothetical protein HVIM_04638 [Roseomonas mucosa]|nr:Hypothetical protein HVIM_04638 [Roseomonas mucosa]QDE01582.1 Hypothetical protein ADP8_04638 [Roseomonas mucosa]